MYIAPRVPSLFSRFSEKLVGACRRGVSKFEHHEKTTSMLGTGSSMAMFRRFVKVLLKTISARGWIISWVLWLIILCVLSSLPQSNVHLPSFPNSDKVAHFLY